MSRLVDADKLYEKFSELETQALEQVGKLDAEEDGVEWHRWSVILVERSAFKHDVADAPTIDAVDRKLFDKVCEFLSEYQPEWICDEMTDIDEEYCEKNCEYSQIPTVCIERYAKLKMDEVTK